MSAEYAECDAATIHLERDACTDNVDCDCSRVPEPADEPAHCSSSLRCTVNNHCNSENHSSYAGILCKFSSPLSSRSRAMNAGSSQTMAPALRFHNRNGESFRRSSATFLLLFYSDNSAPCTCTPLLWVNIEVAILSTTHQSLSSDSPKTRLLPLLPGAGVQT